MYGGSSLNKIVLKMATRLIPLWFAASRAVEVIESGAVARETDKLARMPTQRKHFPKRSRSAPGEEKTGNPIADSGFFDEATARSLSSTTRKTIRLERQPSAISRSIDKERAEQSTRAPVPVPVWLGTGYVLIVWAVCVFAWYRFAQLAAPCAAAGTPWLSHCRTQSHPLFDGALPGPAADLCACNTFAAAPVRKGKNYTRQMNNTSSSSSSSYDCASPRFMDDVYSGMFAGNALATTAPYAQVMIFNDGCAVNNTHVNEMFVQMTNLRVLDVLRSSAIIPPLRLPGAAMTTDSQLMAIRLKDADLETIPSEIGQLGATLSVLCIAGNPQLREIPRELGECTHLGILYLFNNALTTLPSELGRLAGLSTVDLQTNQLSTLPDELGSLTNMQSLSLGLNRLSIVPPSFGRMSSLTNFGLAGNRFSAVPVLDSDPSVWPKLQYMNLEENNITTWPSDWAVEKNVSVAELPFNTTARAVGDDRDGLYDTYVMHQRTATVSGNQEGNGLAGKVGDELSLLVLMGGNPIVSNRTGGRGGDGDILLEIRRGRAVGGLPRILVTSRPSCTTGCRSIPWKTARIRDARGDSWCNAECNMLACQYDGGDCLLD